VEGQIVGLALDSRQPCREVANACDQLWHGGLRIAFPVCQVGKLHVRQEYLLRQAEDGSVPVKLERDGWSCQLTVAHGRLRLWAVSRWYSSAVAIVFMPVLFGRGVNPIIWRRQGTSVRICGMGCQGNLAFQGSLGDIIKRPYIRGHTWVMSDSGIGTMPS